MAPEPTGARHGACRAAAHVERAHIAAPHRFSVPKSDPKPKLICV